MILWLEKNARKIFWTIFLLSISMQVFWIVTLYPNFPHFDEFEIFEQGALDRFVNWAWIFKAHNGHPVVFQRMTLTLMEQIGILNFKVLLLVSNLLLWFTVYLLGQGLVKFTNKNIFLIPCALFVSVLSLENSTFPFQICFHQTFFFFVMLLKLLVLDRSEKSSAFAIGALSLCLAVSSGFGALISLFLPFVFGAYYFRTERQISFGSFVAMIIGSLPGLYYLITSPGAKSDIHLANLSTYLVTLLGLGLGVSEKGYFWIDLFVVVSFLILVVWSVVQAWRDKNISEKRRLWWALITVCLLVALPLAVSRHSQGMDQAKSSRYTIVFLFLHLSYFGLLMEIQVRNLLWKSLFSLAAILFLINWDLVSYRRASLYRIDQMECAVEKYNETSGPIFCPYTFPKDSRVFMDRAKSLGFEFPIQ